MNPVVLVHGFLDTIVVFNTMADYLASKGHSVYRFDLLPNHGYECLETLAHQVAVYIEKRFPDSRPVDLIGFSMGGLVTRYYLQRLDGIKRVERYINISAPNHGTLAAYGLPLAGVRQMRPGSPFLEDLNTDYHRSLGSIQTSILWTPYDLMILPAHSSRLDVGREIRLPVLFHAGMVSEPIALATIRDLLSEPVPTLEFSEKLI